MANFSRRTDWPASPNPLSRTLEALRSQGHPVLDLTVSNPTRCGFKYLAPPLLEPFLDVQNLLYDPDPHGLPHARQAVCEYYSKKGISLTPEQIFLTASTSEAYSFVFRLLADPGDTMLAPEPSYPILDYLTGLHDIQLERYRLSYDHSWRFDLGDLESKIKAGCPKGVLVVHPNNPTGNFANPEEQEKISNLLRAKEIPVISDEVFFDFAWGRGDTPPRSFAAFSGALTFTLSGISKVLGLPQMKLSWIVVNGPEAAQKKAVEKLEIISDTYLSTGTMIQNALPSLMRHQPKITEEILERVCSNHTYLAESIKGQQAVKLLHAEGGWTAMLEFPNTQSDEAWALFFLKKDPVALHPGYLYECRNGTFLVASLLTPPDVFRKGIDRIISGLNP